MREQEQGQNNLKYQLPAPLGKVVGSLKEEGLSVCWYKIKHRLYKKGSYDKWITRQEKQDAVEDSFDYQPMISVLVFSGESRNGVNSVTMQSYGLKECILVNPVSRETVYQAVKKAKGEFVLFLKDMDMLAPNALQEIVRALNKDRTLDYIYSDEDSISQDGKKRWNPLFKPDWSPDTLVSFWYTGHLAAYRTSLLLEMEDFYENTPFWEYDLALRFTERTGHIGHIPKVLYHKTVRKDETPDRNQKDALYKIKQDMITRRQLDAELKYIEDIQEYRVVYHVPENPKVSIIIPSKDHADMLGRCIKSIVEHTAYNNYEILVVDNGSREENKEKVSKLCDTYGVTYIYEPMPFHFSKMCNLGARKASGAYYLFLNDDIQIRDDKDWMTILLGHALQSHVGAVGCKLYYPHTDFIQHCGVVNSFVGPDHIFHHMRDDHTFYLYQNKTDTNFSAVTAACMMVSEKKFSEVSGFEEALDVAYNDVDFCLKLLERGYYNVLRTDVVLWHYESFSRGNDYLDTEKARRLKKERDYLFSRYPWFRYHDPFYNENLTKISMDAAIDDTDYWLEQIPRKDKVVPEQISQGSKVSDLKSTIELNIEDIYEDAYVRLTGYAFDTEKKKAKGVTLFFVSTDDKCYQVTSKKLYRKDIVQIYREKGLAFCGFYFKVQKNRLEPGCYTLYLEADRQVTKLEKQLYVGCERN